MQGRTEKAPAFQCYPADALADSAGMTEAEFTAHWRLVFHAWRDRGIPTDRSRIALLLGMTPAKLAKLWPVVGAPWVEEGGRLVLPWQEAQRKTQAANRQKRKDAANMRWHGTEHPFEPPDDDASAHAHAYPNGGADAVPEHIHAECSTSASTASTHLRDSSAPPSQASPTSESVLRADADAPAPGAPAHAVSLAAAQPERRNGEPPWRPTLIADNTPVGVVALLKAHYGWDGTSKLTHRQRAVRRQLGATILGEGACLEGDEMVRAVDRQHLSDVCAHLAQEPMHNPDGAIRIALVRIRESYVEVRAQREAAERTEDDQARRSRIARGEAWARAHPDAAAQVKRTVLAAVGPRAESTAMGRMVVGQALEQAYADAADQARGDEPPAASTARGDPAGPAPPESAGDEELDEPRDEDLDEALHDSLQDHSHADPHAEAVR